MAAVKQDLRGSGQSEGTFQLWGDYDDAYGKEMSNCFSRAMNCLWSTSISARHHGVDLKAILEQWQGTDRMTM